MIYIGQVNYQPNNGHLHCWLWAGKEIIADIVSGGAANKNREEEDNKLSSTIKSDPSCGIPNKISLHFLHSDVHEKA